MAEKMSPEQTKETMKINPEMETEMAEIIEKELQENGMYLEKNQINSIIPLIKTPAGSELTPEKLTPENTQFVVGGGANAPQWLKKAAKTLYNNKGKIAGIMAGSALATLAGYETFKNYDSNKSFKESITALPGKILSDAKAAGSTIGDMLPFKKNTQEGEEKN